MNATHKTTPGKFSAGARKNSAKHSALPVWLALACASSPLVVGAGTVWTGPHITKGDTNGPDAMTALVALTRGSTQGLYNSQQEGGFTHFLSPVDTEWADGTIANTNLAYTDWNTWSKITHGGPPSTVGVNAVLHLKTDDIYMDIKFLSWATGTSTYSYERSTPTPANVPPSITITNPVNGTSYNGPQIYRQ